MKREKARTKLERQGTPVDVVFMDAHHAQIPNEETSTAFPHHTSTAFPELSERLTESTADESAHAELEDDYESPARLSTVNE